MNKRTTAPPDLTELESEVMGAIWDADTEPVTVRQILERVNSGRQKVLAYNTVQTVFHLLRQKNAIKRVASVGRAHAFVANCSRGQTTRQMLGGIAERIFGGRLQPMIHQMIDDADLSDEELQELRDWVDQKLKDSKTRPSRKRKPKGSSK